MCGIAGFLDVNAAQSSETLEAHTRRMIGTLTHRGPDGFGVWVDPRVGIAVGHRRLAVLDLSESGRQPMVSACGRYVISFNGEIYNFEKLREELAAERAALDWRGHSDTEVLLGAISHWGLEGAIRRSIGMFAIALWDRTDRLLHLVRDRMGEKPLYYGWAGDVFLFGSELKALRAHPAWRGEIDRSALTLYLRYNYVPAPYSIYRGIRKLLPGTILTIPADGRPHHDRPPIASPYWSLDVIARAGAADPFGGDEVAAESRLEELLKQSIRGQMVADVPVGIFLSGGIDSSTMVALMQSQSDRPVKTFTIGFHEEAYDEAAHARTVARHLGTDHHELYVSPEDALGVIPRLPQIYDEPFADSSQVPTYLVCQLARRQVTVSLSGDGGDELFGGYNRYFWGRKIWRSIGWMPPALRRSAAALLRALSHNHGETVLGRLGPVLPSALRVRNPGDKLQKLADVLAVVGPDEMYRRLISHWKNPAEIVIGGSEPPPTHAADNARFPDFTHRMMFQDAIGYLPDDILVKVDRAAMAVSLETRVPMLDHRVVEFAWSLPLSMKIRHDRGKWLLQKVLHRHVPKQYVERPKTGFGVPIDGWLRGPLRDWAEALLDESRLRAQGFFDPVPIRTKWHEHCAGRRNWQYYLWDILMFQAWLEHASATGASAASSAPADMVVGS